MAIQKFLSDAVLKRAEVKFLDTLKSPALDIFSLFTEEITDKNQGMKIADLATDNDLLEVYSSGADFPETEIKDNSATVSDRFFRRQLKIGAYEVQSAEAKLLAIATKWALAIARKKNKLVSTILDEATTTDCVDGQYLIDTDHPGSSDQSNKSTDTFAYDPVTAGIEAMNGFTDEYGELIGADPDYIIVGRSNKTSAQEILNAINIPGNANNDANPGAVRQLQLIVYPFMNANSWFLYDSKLGRKPVYLHTHTEYFKTVGPDELNRYTSASEYIGAAGAGAWEALYGYVGS